MLNPSMVMQFTTLQPLWVFSFKLKARLQSFNATWREARRSRWSKPQQIQVLVFHCHMVTSACTMHQLKHNQSLVYRCHAVTGACAMHQFKQTQSLFFRCHMVTSACAMHQFKQAQSLVFRCHAVIRRMRNVTDSVSLFNVAMLLRYSAWAVNKRPCVHFLCNLSPKLHWHYYIIQLFFLNQWKALLVPTTRNSILNF